MSLFLNLVIWVNVAALFAVHLLNAVMAFVTMDFWGAISRLQETYSPFNIRDWIANVVLLLPAIAAFWWKSKREDRRREAGRMSEK